MLYTENIFLKIILPIMIFIKIPCPIPPNHLQAVLWYYRGTTEAAEVK